MRVNLKRYWLGALLLASLSLLLFGCGDFGSSRTNVATKTISGAVSDPATGMPQSGATVQAFALATDGSETPLSVNPATTTTAADGSYSLHIPADYRGSVVVKASASGLGKRLKQLFATTIGGNTTTVRAVVPASLLADGELPPIMISLATEALYQYVNVNNAQSGMFTEQNIRAAALILENFFGANFGSTPPPATGTVPSQAQQDLLVTIQAIASLTTVNDVPALVVTLTAPLDGLAGEIKNNIQTVTFTLKAQGTIPNEFVPSATIITGISNAEVAALQADPALLADVTPPAAPANLAAPVVGARSVQLNWDPVSDTGLDGYVVCRADRSDVFVSIASVPAGAHAYTDLTVAAQTRYSYKVIAFDKARNLSSGSNVITVTTPTSTDSIAPAAPTGLVSIANAADQVALHWTQSIKTANDGSTVAASVYYIFRDGNLIGSTAGTTFYTDSTVAPLTQYTYYVKAADANGNLSGPSNTLSVRTPSAVSATGAVYAAGLTVTDNTTGTRVTLKFNTVSAAGAKYNVYRDGLLLASGLVAPAGAATVSFSDGTVLPLSTYIYKVSYTSTTDSGLVESQLSDPLQVTTAAGGAVSGSAPSVPTNLVVGTPTSSSVPLTWTASTPAAGDSFVAYEIYRRDMATTDSVKLATVIFPALAGVQPAFVDTTVQPLKTYGYWVIAVSSSGIHSLASVPALSLPIPAAVTPTGPPNAPTNLTATPTRFSVTLAWTASNSTGVAGYLISRNGSQIADVPASTTSYIDSALAAGTSFSYRVVAYDSLGNLSDPATVSTATLPSFGLTISGRITLNGQGVANITVTAKTGTSTFTGTTDGNGNYVIGAATANDPQLPDNASYTVSCPTPADTGFVYAFSPQSKNLALHGANLVGVDFIAQSAASISGTVTFPDGTIIGGITYPPGSVINGVTYPTGATVINGVVYPTGTVIGGVTYPNGTVIGGVAYPSGTVVGGIAFPVGYDASGFANLTVVNVGTTYPTGVVAGGVYYATGVVEAGLIFTTGGVSGQVSYPTGVVTGTLFFKP